MIFHTMRFFIFLFYKLEAPLMTKENTQILKFFIYKGRPPPYHFFKIKKKNQPDWALILIFCN